MNLASQGIISVSFIHSRDKVLHVGVIKPASAAQGHKMGTVLDKEMA